MYCKKCGKEYKKDKKVCKECGIALTPGVSPKTKNKSNARVMIIAGAVVVIVIAVFLIIGLGGMVPAALQGTWYETTGMGGTLAFKSYGELDSVVFGVAYKGTYQYDGATQQGIISRNTTDEEGDLEFTCDGTTLEVSGATFTKQYVEQQTLDDLFGGMAQ